MHLVLANSLCHCFSYSICLYKETVQVNLLIHCVCHFIELMPPEKSYKLNLCVKDLPKANYQTLKMLSDHLRKYDGINI